MINAYALCSFAIKAFLLACVLIIKCPWINCPRMWAHFMTVVTQFYLNQSLADKGIYLLHLGESHLCHVPLNWRDFLRPHAFKVKGSHLSYAPLNWRNFLGLCASKIEVYFSGSSSFTEGSCPIILSSARYKFPYLK